MSIRIVDLSHIIEGGMPVYPGTEPPVLTPANTLEADGFKEKRITMFSHTGTHMDAPAHILAEAPGLDELNIDRFIGNAALVDVSDLSGGVVDRRRLKPRIEAIAEAEWLLLRTGWSNYWGLPGYFDGYPVLTEDAALWLTDFGLKGLGVDAISVDPVDSRNLPVHRVLLGAGMCLVENLVNLEAVPADGFRFAAFPLRIRDADGSPVRAAAFVGGD